MFDADPTTLEARAIQMQMPRRDYFIVADRHAASRHPHRSVAVFSDRLFLPLSAFSLGPPPLTRRAAARAINQYVAARGLRQVELTSQHKSSMEKSNFV